MAELFLGLSGYSYKPWQGEGRFYPPELKAKEFFGYYAERFNAVEMDSTWYRMPTEAGVAAWIEQAPPGFRYTFKVHRKVTHMSRLKEDGIDPMDFFIKRLRPAIEAGVVGMVYLQLPPNLRRTDDRLEKFLLLLPPGPRYGVEFRHESWDTDEVADILRAHQVAFVASDSDDRKGVRRDTGLAHYARLRKEAYTDEEIASWAGWVQDGLRGDQDVYVFMKHEDEGSPWLDADRLRLAMR